MESMLRKDVFEAWANILADHNRHIDDDPEEVIYRILRLFDGMGSLNDIVLQKNGERRVEENETFSGLKNKLYDMCTRHI